MPAADFLEATFDGIKESHGLREQAVFRLPKSDMHPMERLPVGIAGHRSDFNARPFGKTNRAAGRRRDGMADFVF